MTAPLQTVVFCHLGIISPAFRVRLQGIRGEGSFLRHTGTKGRGGAAHAKSVSMKMRQSRGGNNAPLEEKSNNE